MKSNKQLVPIEIVFRFRKDIGSPRKPRVVIYSQWEVSGHGGFVVPFTLPQGRGYVLQARKWFRAANDPSTANGPQIGPQMILRREMIPANGVAKTRECRELYE